MLINKKDISEWNAKQWKISIWNHDIENESEWIRGSPVPFLGKNTIGFKTLQIVLLIKGECREEMNHDRSKILSMLLEPVELKLEGFEHSFYGILKKHSFKEDVGTFLDRWHKLTLEFDAYEYSETISVSGSGSVTLTNPGNIPGPAVIEITPIIGAASIILTGVCRNSDTGEDDPVTIKNLETGKTVILDGETGLITQNGVLKAGDVEIWEVPTILPGENTITCNSQHMSMTVKIKPRYM